MKIKLSLKLFGAFFLILVIAVCAMILSRHLFALNFRNYIDQVELKRLESLVPILQEQYRISGGWTGISNDAQIWRDRLNETFFNEIKRYLPPPDKDPRKHLSRILLVDAKSQPIIGVPKPEDHVRMVRIESETQLVGWLGLKKREYFKSGPPAELIRRNNQQLYYLSGGVIALTALIAFLFSRHLLRPIKLLTEGTRALAQRKFGVYIKPTTRDELAILAENFNGMAQTLQNYEKMQRRWVADISHELRTPLAVLQGEIEALQDGVRDPNPDNLASLQAEILRLKRLVDDLHLLALADSSQLSLERQLLEPGLILNQIIGTYRPRFDRLGITLEMEIGALTGIRLRADGDRLGQVFNNILDNACKYMHTPGVLKISGNIEGSTLSLTFEDSGPGVPSNALGRLFDRLYRVESSRSRDHGGSGLGLSISRDIIDKHQGETWAGPSSLGGILIGIALPLQTER